MFTRLESRYKMVKLYLDPPFYIPMRKCNEAVRFKLGDLVVCIVFWLSMPLFAFTPYVRAFTGLCKWSI